MTDMRVTKIALIAAAIALVAGGPALAASTKPAKGAAAAPAAMTADDLNAKSLVAAKAGTDFVPPK
jgi:hypothetical protein